MPLCKRCVINGLYFWNGLNHMAMILVQIHGYTDTDYSCQHKDKDPFIGPQEFVVGYSKAPKQPQSSA